MTRKNRLRWLGCVLRREKTEVVRLVKEMCIIYSKKEERMTEKEMGDVIMSDMSKRGVCAGNRVKW